MAIRGSSETPDGRADQILNFVRALFLAVRNIEHNRYSRRNKGVHEPDLSHVRGEDLKICKLMSLNL